MTGAQGHAGIEPLVREGYEIVVVEPGRGARPTLAPSPGARIARRSSEIAPPGRAPGRLRR